MFSLILPPKSVKEKYKNGGLRFFYLTTPILCFTFTRLGAFHIHVRFSGRKRRLISVDALYEVYFHYLQVTVHKDSFKPEFGGYSCPRFVCFSDFSKICPLLYVYNQSLSCSCPRKRWSMSIQLCSGFEFISSFSRMIPISGPSP